MAQGFGHGGAGACGGVGQDSAQGEDVRGWSDAGTVGLLGGHVGQGAADRAAGGHAVGVQGADHAEVDNAGSVVGEDDVGRFEVAVHQVTGVDGFQALGEAGGDPGHFSVGVGVYDLCGVEAADFAGGVGFAGEPGAELIFVCEVGTDDLDDQSASGGGVGRVDLAHAACAQTQDEAIDADAGRVGGVEGFHGVAWAVSSSSDGRFVGQAVRATRSRHSACTAAGVRYPSVE